MTDAFVDPFPNEGALCHSVAAQCRVCMEGVQQWSHSLCHLMSRKHPPTSLLVCNESCKDAPAGSPLWCPFGAFLVCVQTKELLVGRNPLEKTTKMKMKMFPSGGRRRMPRPSVPLPSVSSQHWHCCRGPASPSLAVGIYSCQLFVRLFCVFARQYLSWLLIFVWASMCNCCVKSSSVHLSNKHHLGQEVLLEGSVSVKFLFYAGIMQGS